MPTSCTSILTQMSKKGFVTVNVIIIMIFLNMILLTTFTMQRRMLNASYRAIELKSVKINSSSKKIVIDEYILRKIKDDIVTKNKIIPSTTNPIKHSIDNTLWDIVKSYPIIQGSTLYTSYTGTVSENTINFITDYTDEARNIHYIRYCIVCPTATDIDRDFIENNDGNAIWDRYKDSIVMKTTVYIKRPL